MLLEAVAAKRLAKGMGANQKMETGPQGEFTFAAVAPGEYRLYAFEGTEEEISEDPEVLRNFLGKSVIVKIGEGETKTVTLARITASEVEEAQNR